MAAYIYIPTIFYAVSGMSIFSSFRYILISQNIRFHVSLFILEIQILVGILHSFIEPVSFIHMALK